MGAICYFCWSSCHNSSAVVLSYSRQVKNAFESSIDSFQDWLALDIDFEKAKFFYTRESKLRSIVKPVNPSGNPTRLSVEGTSFRYPSFYDEERKYLEHIVEKLRLFLTKYSGSRKHYDNELREWKESLEETTSNDPVLQDVSIEVNKGKIVALLGRNGAGKSSLIKLMLRHYDPDSGEVLLDGVPVYKIDRNKYHQQIAWVDQSPLVIDSFSLRDNLLLGVIKKISDQALFELLSAVSLDEIIKSSNKGLDSVLGEDCDLSGGQRQMLAVLRALLQERQFVFFDEAMSNLDIEKESKIISLLKEQKEKAGIVFITHRITTARHADYVYFMDKGKIVEEGTHAELIKKKGEYAHFWNLQVVS